MSLRPAIIHLIGHPGVGKYTVAKALVAAAADSGERMVLMDNHATGNLILSILEPVDPIPGEVWDRVGEVREVVYRTIADMSPPEWSFVFTNVLVADDPGDEAVVVRLARLAQESDRHYLPVRLTCELDAHLERVASPERGPRHKWTNVDAVRPLRSHVRRRGPRRARLPRRRHDPPCAGARGRGHPRSPRDARCGATAMSGARPGWAQQAFECDGTSTRQHNEPAGNQDLWHLHVHVFPRFEGDDLYRSWYRESTPEERLDFAARLRAVL